MRIANPVIEWCKRSNKPCLKFTFRGYLEADEAESAVDMWKGAFIERQEGQVILVWDCLNMTGYSRRARSTWTRAMLEMKSQIAAIWLISNSPLIKMGASVMALFSGLEVHIVTSESEIREYALPPSAPFLKRKKRDDQTDSLSL